jgi:glutamyl-Q tRNA(Asp) synthetase
MSSPGARHCRRCRFRGEAVAGFRTRFAPSPTGYLHLGHAFSALTAWGLAEAAGGECLLRIEDLDLTRVRPEFEPALREDLGWLGLRWPEPVLRQSEHQARYAAALDRLGARGLTYPCSCSRAEIRAALSAPHGRGEEAPQVYPGTCRGRSMAERRAGDAIRLDLGAALERVDPGALAFEEQGPSHAAIHRVDPDWLRDGIGDVVLGRKDTQAAAYHLAVVVDDAFQQITHVVRGEDLWEVTSLHRLLQALLDLPVPVWHHHRLVTDASGRRLAKRDHARALRTMRAEGITPGGIRALAGV